MTYAEEIACKMLENENYSKEMKEAVLKRVRKADELVGKCGGYIQSRQVVAAIIVSMAPFFAIPTKPTSLRTYQ